MYILDEDPKKAASYLSIEHTDTLLLDFNMILKDFNRYKRGKNSNRKYLQLNRKVLASFLSKNAKYYLWGITFYEALQKFRLEAKGNYIGDFESILDKAMNIPECLLNIDIDNGAEDKLVLDSISVGHLNLGLRLKADLSFLKNEKLDTVSKYRLLYILKGYRPQDFLRGVAPEWYVNSCVTIFEKYFIDRELRTRIDLIDGRLHYYLGGVTENWTEIDNVPPQVDVIVNSILFENNP